jgi:hypothetical protein
MTNAFIGSNIIGKSFQKGEMKKKVNYCAKNFKDHIILTINFEWFNFGQNIVKANAKVLQTSPGGTN